MRTMTEKEFLNELDESLEQLNPRELQIVARNASKKIILSVFGFDYNIERKDLFETHKFTGSESEISRKKLLLTTLEDFMVVSTELKEEYFYGLIEGIYLVWECLTELGFGDQMGISIMSNFLQEARKFGDD